VRARKGSESTDLVALGFQPSGAIFIFYPATFRQDL
jgi:hypothetical protein